MDARETGTVSLFWQLPQYLFISLAEILVCVPALELAYEDSPPHLRSLVTAMWYISQVQPAHCRATVTHVQALGNLVDVVLFLGLDVLSQWQLFDIFCAIMLVASAFFIRHIRGCVFAAQFRASRAAGTNTASSCTWWRRRARPAPPTTPRRPSPPSRSDCGPVHQWHAMDYRAPRIFSGWVARRATMVRVRRFGCGRRGLTGGAPSCSFR